MQRLKTVVIMFCCSVNEGCWLVVWSPCYCACCWSVLWKRWRCAQWLLVATQTEEQKDSLTTSSIPKLDTSSSALSWKYMLNAFIKFADILISSHRPCCLFTSQCLVQAARACLNYSFNRINWSAAGFWNVTVFVSNSDVDLNPAAVAWVFAVVVLINGPFLGKNCCKYCEEKTRRSEKLSWRVISVLHVEFNCSH